VAYNSSFYALHESATVTSHMLTSIIHNNQLCYPEKDEYFSPSAPYPEYPFSHFATKPNFVYQAVRECFKQVGLDAKNFGTLSWNPLKDYIKQGNKVFVLCNFVYHRRSKESLNDFFAKCTHASIIRAIIDYVYIALKREGSILFGNDTAWRMTVDLAYILHFADTNGLLTHNPQRKHLVFVDGVIGGEGNGPLSPNPVESRSVIFSDNIVYGDVVACKLMGYDNKKIPLINYSEHINKLIFNPASQENYCILNGKRIKFYDLQPVLKRSFVPPIGWQGYL